MINNGYKALYIVISVGGSLCEVQTTDQEHNESNTRTLKMSRNREGLGAGTGETEVTDPNLTGYRDIVIS